MDTHHFRYRLHPCLRGQLFMDKYPKPECINFWKRIIRAQKGSFENRAGLHPGTLFWYQRNWIFHIFSNDFTFTFLNQQQNYLFHLYFTDFCIIRNHELYPKSVIAQASQGQEHTAICQALENICLSEFGILQTYYCFRPHRAVPWWKQNLCTGLQTTNHYFALCQYDGLIFRMSYWMW